MSTIVLPEHYDQIRAAIDVSLTSDDLGDDVIRQSIYLGAADAEIKRRDPAWATRTDAELALLRTAAIYLTAARIAPAVPQLKSERYPEGYGYDRAIDYTKRAAELRALAEVELGAVLAPSDPAAMRPTLFAVASAERGR